MSAFHVIALPSFSDERGGLSVLENVLPFPMQRVYWIYRSDDQLRGGHRHRLTRQALICVHGTVTVHMDDGAHTADICLSSPDQCLLVEPEDWHTMKFGEAAVLLVVASREYDKSDYIDEGYR